MPQFDRCISDHSVPVRELRSRNAGRGQAHRSLSPPRASSCLASTSERPGINYRDREDSHCSGHYGGDRPFQSNKGGFCNGAGKKTFSARAVCLGRHPHKIVECASPRTWDQIHLALATAAGVRAPQLVHRASESIETEIPGWGPVLKHDFAHSLLFDTSKLRRLVPGFAPAIPFAAGAREIVEWYDADPTRRSVDDDLDAAFDRLAARP